MMNNVFSLKIVAYLCKVACVLFLLFGITFAAEAASLFVSPGTNVYSSGSTFSVRVVVNSNGQAINAAEGTLRFNPSELSVVSVNRAGSIFNLWVAEPSFSNSAGTVSFSGGLPSGYTGSNGNIMTVTFRAVGSGPAKVTFASGSVLANDGRGTNVLSGMNGGTYTIQAASESPAAEEVVVEYVAPANTPGLPVINSETHPDPQGWSSSNTAELRWALPAGVTAVRTLLSDSATAIPNIVYDSPISSISLELEEGVQYFHLQFRNEDGWGRVAHYRLAVDTEAPTDIAIATPEGADLTNPVQELAVTVSDSVSEVRDFIIRIDAAEPFTYQRDTATGTIQLPELEPGYHTVVIEALDAAGNSIVGTYSFTIEAFERPVFTDFPSQINEEVIPVITGTTRPNAAVEVTLQKLGSEPTVYSIQSNDEGVFTFIPENRLTSGVYELTAKAVDVYGAHSEISEPVRIAVQQPGYVRIGSVVLSFFSVLIPLIALLFVTGLMLWYFWFYFIRLKKRVTTESVEALAIVKKEFATLKRDLSEQEEMLKSSRKTKKLTKAEEKVFTFMNAALQDSEAHIKKEVEDVAEVVDAKENNT